VAERLPRRGVHKKISLRISSSRRLAVATVSSILFSTGLTYQLNPKRCEHHLYKGGPSRVFRSPRIILLSTAKA
jgi:hypothetical protein